MHMNIINRTRPETKLTIITVAYNAKDTIAQTISSVAAQTTEYVEYLIIDGASSDGTVDILRQMSSDIDYWLSEPDNGIYDAMNKGIAMASGEWIMFLNADDYLASARSIQFLLEAADDSIDIVAGKTIMKSAHDERLFHPSRHFGLMLQLPFMHPAIIVRRSVFEICGYFDTRYRLAADCDFLLRAIKLGHRYREINEVVTVMRDGGASQRGFIRGRLEYMAAYRRNMRNPIRAYLGFAVSIAMYFRAKLRGRGSRS